MTVDTNDVITLIRNGDKVGMLVYLRNRGDPNSRNQMGWTLLHMACLEGQGEITRILLDAGAMINSCTTDMCTPLHRACSGGNEGPVRVLLEKGAYINAQDKQGNTPLHEAAKGLHTSVVKQLIEKKADVTRTNKKNQLFTDLVGQQMMPVIESGDIDTLITWLDWGLSANTFGNLNWSLLHHASAMGQINIASVLLERGADVNAIDSNRSCPLHGACFHGHKRIVELLIGSAANVNVQDQRGNTPIHSVITGGHPDIINLLLDSGCETSIPNAEGQIFTHLVNEFLQDAIDKNKVAHVIALLKGRANPNTTDAAGTPVLCCASFKGDILMVDALLEAKADPNLCSKDSQKSPLHYAASAGHLFVLKSLLDKSASVHLKDRNGSTALHEAAREGAEDVITVLSGRGSALNAQDIDGNTPLHIAAKWGQATAVELLIEKGAADDIKNKSGLLYSDLALMRAVRTEDASQVLSGLAWGGNPDVQDEKGWTLLHHAAYKGATEVCNVLLESGANVDIMDKHGRTPLLLAAYRGNQEIMEKLLNSSANMNAQDNKGQTPLHWAADEGSIGAVELLLQRGADRSLKNKKDCLYSDLLLKHLYFAVRHNDSQKVECLLKAGADQTAILRGTGTTPRDEAKRRKLYPILKKMVAMAPKKKIPPPSKEASFAIEDVSRLFENHDDQGESSSDDESNNHEEEWDPDEDAYWKMHNAAIVLKAKDIFQEEDHSFWEHWEEKPKVISAKEFFKDELPWWVTKESSSGSESSSEESEDEKIPTFEELKQEWGHVVSAKEFFREDECWWRDAVEEIDETTKQDVISAKEFFKEDTAWWEVNSDDEQRKEKWVPAKEFFKDDKPWWESDANSDEIDDSLSIEDTSISDVEVKKPEEVFNEEEDLDESLTDDWDTANESVVSETGTMFSASEGEKVPASEIFAQQPWWDLDNEDVTEDIDTLDSDSIGKDSLENISDDSELIIVNGISGNADIHPKIRQLRKRSLTESESSATLLDSYGSNDALNDDNYVNEEVFDFGNLKSDDKEFPEEEIFSENNLERNISVESEYTNDSALVIEEVNLPKQISVESISNISVSTSPQIEIIKDEDDNNFHPLENHETIFHELFDFDKEISPINCIAENLECSLPLVMNIPEEEPISKNFIPERENDYKEELDSLPLMLNEKESLNEDYNVKVSGNLSTPFELEINKNEDYNLTSTATDSSFTAPPVLLNEIESLSKDKSVELSNKLETHIELQVDKHEDSPENLTKVDSNISFTLSKAINETPITEVCIIQPSLNKIENIKPGQELVNKIANSKQQKYLKYRDEKNVRVAKPVINKMDACLAKVDATLAWLDARMANDIQSDSNECVQNLLAPSSDVKMMSFTTKIGEAREIKRELEPEGHINIFKINVRVPDEIKTNCENMIQNDKSTGLGHAIKNQLSRKSITSSMEDIIKNTDPQNTCDESLYSSALSHLMESNSIGSKFIHNENTIQNLIAKENTIQNLIANENTIQNLKANENTNQNLIDNENDDKGMGDKNLLEENISNKKETQPTEFRDVCVRDRCNKVNETPGKGKFISSQDIPPNVDSYFINSASTKRKEPEALKINSVLPDTLLGHILTKEIHPSLNECHSNENLNKIEPDIILNSATPISAKLQVVLTVGTPIISTTPDLNNFTTTENVIRPPRRRTKKLDSQNSSLEDHEEIETKAKMDDEEIAATKTKHLLGRDSSTNITDTYSIDMPPTAPRRKRDSLRSTSSSDIHFIDTIKPKNYQINLLSDSDPAETHEIEEVYQQHLPEKLVEVIECPALLISTTTAEAPK